MNKIKLKRKKLTLRQKIFIVAMMIVPLLHFLVFYIYVNISSVLMSFQMLKNGEMVYTLENFAMFFQQISYPDSTMVKALVNTMIFFGVSLVVILPITGFIAYFIYKKIFAYKFHRIMFFLPSILSAVVLTILYSNIIGVDGPIAKIFQAITGAAKPPEFFDDSRYAKWTIVVYCIWTGFGTNLILLSGAMNRIPEEVIEASKLDGVGMLRELGQIIIPLVWPTVTTLIVFSFVGIFTASGPILLFTKGARDTYTISYWIFEQVYANAGRPEYASAVGLMFTVFAFPIVLIVKWLMEKWQDAIEY